MAGTAGAYYLIRQQPAEPQNLVEEAAPLLVGTYAWEGIECGDGPRITREGNAVVATMEGTPSVRHTVARIERSDLVGTRIFTRAEDTEPRSTSQATADYVFEVRPLNATLVVNSIGRSDEWMRCDSEFAVEYLAPIVTAAPMLTGTTPYASSLSLYGGSEFHRLELEAGASYRIYASLEQRYLGLLGAELILLDAAGREVARDTNSVAALNVSGGQYLLQTRLINRATRVVAEMREAQPYSIWYMSYDPNATP